MAIDSYILGTIVKVQSVVSPASPDAVVITIVDSAGTTKIDEAAMTADDTTTYFYLFQSATTDVEGRFYVTIKCTKGSYVGISKKVFELRSS